MSKKTMLIDGTHAEEVRIVLMNDGKLEEFEFESAHKDINRGSIYVGEVTRIEPSLQAAFISYGGNRNGFLAFNEVHPSYYNLPQHEKEALLEEFNDRGDDEDDTPDDNNTANEQEAATPPDSDTPDSENDASETDAPQSNEKIAAGADVKEIHKAPKRHGAKTKRPQRRSRQNETNTEQGDPAHDQQAPARTAANSPAKNSGNTPNEQLIADARARAEADAKAAGDNLSADEIEENARALALANDVVTKPVPEEERKPRKGRRRTSKSGKQGKPEQEKPDEEQAAAQQSGAQEAAPQTETKDDDAAPRQETATPSGGGSGSGSGSGSSQPRARSTVAVHRRFNMDEVLKPGQKVLVQVNKEERGNKGAALTTYISLPGRFTVLMPNTPYAGGISRKITDGKDRKTLKNTIEKLQIPNGMGLIVRTAGMGQSEEDITHDVKQLRKSWDKLSQNWEKEDVTSLMHEDGNLVIRAMRDMLTEEVDQVVIAGKKPLKLAKEYTKLMMPEKAKIIKEHRATQPIFAHYGIEMELHLLDRTRVNLPSGGYLILNPTEALVSVDVNSGRATQEKNIENTALNTNIEAAHELARQLRLRDLAGLIVVDFIDMEDRRNDRKVERAMRDALRKDRARSQVGGISDFGLLEMSRQRLHPSLGESNYNTCPHCQGKGMIRSPESAATIILRGLEEENICNKADRIVITASTQVAVYMLNYKRDMISALENTYKIRIVIQDDSKYIAPDHRLDLIRVSGDGTEKSQTMERAFREDLEENNKKRKRKRRNNNKTPDDNKKKNPPQHKPDAQSNPQNNPAAAAKTSAPTAPEEAKQPHKENTTSKGDEEPKTSPKAGSKEAPKEGSKSGPKKAQPERKKPSRPQATKDTKNTDETNNAGSAKAAPENKASAKDSAKNATKEPAKNAAPEKKTAVSKTSHPQQKPQTKDATKDATKNTTKPDTQPVTKPLEVETIHVADKNHAHEEKNKKKTALQRWWSK